MSNDDADGLSMRRFSELPESDGPISRDVVYTLLSSARRRYLLLALLETSGTTDVSTLIEAVTVREFGERFTYDQRKRIYVSLRQTHLPRLAEADVVAYDPDRGEVRPGEHFDTVTLPLRIVRNPVAVFLPFELPDWISLLRVQGLQRHTSGGVGRLAQAQSKTHPVAGAKLHAPESASHGFAAVLELLRILL